MIVVGCSTLPPPTLSPELLAPDFSLKALDGSPVTLSTHRGRWVLLNFWATWCKPCIAELPLLQTLAGERPDDLRVFAINLSEDVGQVHTFLRQHELNLTVVIAPDALTLLAYQVVSLPLTVIISPHGEIVCRRAGPVDRAFVEACLG